MSFDSVLGVADNGIQLSNFSFLSSMNEQVFKLLLCINIVAALLENIFLFYVVDVRRSE
jgi:hypothetical protein